MYVSTRPCRQPVSTIAGSDNRSVYQSTERPGQTEHSPDVHPAHGTRFTSESGNDYDVSEEAVEVRGKVVELWSGEAVGRLWSGGEAGGGGGMERQRRRW